MRRKLADYRLFIREFYRHFHSTGALLPSGRALAAALSHHVRAGTGPRRILEVGPGTGAVTQKIVQDLKPADELHLVELNEQFVAHLRQRFDTEPSFQQVRDRVTIVHGRLEDLPRDQPYELIVSCLPLNNFQVDEVQQILSILSGMLGPGGILSFFEYIAIRPVKSVVCTGSERARLRGISSVLDDCFTKHEIGRKAIWANVPPAWVHHLSFQDAGLAHARTIPQPDHRSPVTAVGET